MTILNSPPATPRSQIQPCHSFISNIFQVRRKTMDQRPPLQPLDLDKAFSCADTWLWAPDQPSKARSQRALANFEGLCPQEAQGRLAWRPQPTIITNEGFLQYAYPNNVSSGKFQDLSMFFMFKDSFHILGLVVTKEMVDRMIAHKVHYPVWGNFLSLIDAYRVVSASFHTPNVTEHVGIVSRLTSELSSLSMHGFWSSGVTPSREEQAKRCSVYSLYQRVEFYRMRAYGPNPRDFNARMQAFRKDAGISDDWDVCDEVKRLLEEAIELEVDVWDKLWASPSLSKTSQRPFPQMSLPKMLASSARIVSHHPASAQFRVAIRIAPSAWRAGSTPANPCLTPARNAVQSYSRSQSTK